MENLTEQQLQSIANYKRSGVFEIKILKNNIVKFKQIKVEKGILFNRAELLERARTIFPEDKFVIIPTIFCPSPKELTEKYFKDKMDKLGLSSEDLTQQIDIDGLFLDALINDPKNEKYIAKLMKITYFYFLLSHHISKEFLDYVDYIDNLNE